MRLLNVHTLELRAFDRDVPKYVTTSFIWSVGTEATMGDVMKRRNTDSPGFEKVKGLAESVREHIGHVDWLWIDTCCVDQASSQEVSEASNSTFRRHLEAEACLVYLEDVRNAKDEGELRQSAWFRQAWTLQDLLAPSVVVFLSQKWDVIGHKGGSTKSGFPVNIGPSLVPILASITGIPEAVLYGYNRSKGLSVEERLAWMTGRETTRPEDMTYSLLGIFGVCIPLIYGEGAERARRRLLSEILKASIGTSSALEDTGQRTRKREGRLKPPSPCKKSGFVTSL